MLLCIVGVVTAGDRFASVDNVMTILRLASVIGVVSVGMTFVIGGGGIDLSVGAIVALSQRLGDHRWPPRPWRDDSTGSSWSSRPSRSAPAVVSSTGCSSPTAASRRSSRPSRCSPAARGLAEIIAQRQTQIITSRAFIDFFGGERLGVPVLVIIFALVAVIGWVLLNRTTFGRRTLAVGGNPEAARLAGIKVQRQTMYLYILVGLACGLAAVMIMARTTTGTSTHGGLYELDAIAAVVIGGTLLSGGRGDHRRHRASAC